MNTLGHNSQNKTLDDFVIAGTGRVKITDQIVRDLLKPTYENGIPKDRIIYDSEVIGLRCRIRVGGSKKWFYEFTPHKSKSTKRYTFGTFPEVRTAEARILCKKIKFNILHIMEKNYNPQDGENMALIGIIANILLTTIKVL